MPPIRDLITAAYKQVTLDATFSDQWFIDETLYRAVNNRYPDISNLSNFNREAFNRALGNIGGGFDGSNQSGIYKTKFKTLCPYGGNRRNITYYYRQVHQGVPSQPEQASDVEDLIAKSHKMRENRERIAAAEKEARKHDTVGKAITSLEEEKIKAAEKQEKKQKEKAAAAAEGKAASTPTGSKDNASKNITPDKNITNVGMMGMVEGRAMIILPRRRRNQTTNQIFIGSLLKRRSYLELTRIQMWML